MKACSICWPCRQLSVSASLALLPTFTGSCGDAVGTRPSQLSLRAWRRTYDPKLTQAEVAFALGIREDSYARIERGIMRPGTATAATLDRLRADRRYALLIFGR